MQISKYILQHIETLTGDYITYAETRFPEAEKLPREQIQDHIKGVLNQIAEDTAKGAQHNDVASLDDINTPPADETYAQIHGKQRVETGLTITDLNTEYCWLRHTILNRWIAQDDYVEGASIMEVMAFNNAIDKALAQSIARYHTTIESARNLFLAVLGHDIRNPLSAIGSTAEILSRSTNLNEKEQLLSKQIKISVKHITAITDNLLELARIRMGSSLTINPADADMAQIAMEAIEEVRTFNPQANIVMNVEGSLNGRWDSMRMKQMLANLLRNAVQHGDMDYPITITAVTEHNQIKLLVHNKGTPIPNDKINYVFDRYSIPTSGKTTQNLGLGLYIVSEIVKAHKGEIQVTSNEKDGTNFTVTLPHNIPSASLVISETQAEAAR